jgi:RecA-family ATPase
MTMRPIDVVLDALRAHGCNPRQNGDGWTHHCPAHDDKHASGTLHEGADGKVLARCHRGEPCGFSEIAAALDLPETAFFPPKDRDPKPKILATYDYTNENGELLYQTVRYTPKDFRQRRPDGNGGWEWNLNGVRRVPYRLPDVRNAIELGLPIFIPEGEKDADAVAREGETGTTSPMGAGKWRPEYADAFAGASTVFVVADRDGPGYQHARQVAASLEGRVGEVTVVEPVEGNDLTDHLAAGYTLNDLAVADLQEPQDSPPDDHEPAAQRPPLRAIPVRQTLATPPPEPDPLAAGLVNRGDRIVMGAGRAWNKSLFVAQLGWKLAEGDGLFLRDFLVKRRCRVLIAQGEVTHHQSFVRWHMLTSGEAAPDGVDETYDRWKIRTIRKRRRDPVEDCYEEWPEAILDPRLETTIAEHAYDLLVLDPWASYFTGSENSNDETEAALDTLAAMADRTGLAIWINHHFSQRGTSDKIDPEDAWRGASRLADWASTRITLLPHYTPKKANELGYSRIEARRYLDVRFLTRGAPIDDFSLHRRDDLWLERWDDPNTGEADDHVEALINPVVAVVDAEPTTKILNKQDVSDRLKAAKVKFDANNLARAILAAAQRGLITAEKSGNVWRIQAIEKTP